MIVRLLSVKVHRLQHNWRRLHCEISKQVDLARSFANPELASELRQRKAAVAFVKTFKKAVRFKKEELIV